MQFAPEARELPQLFVSAKSVFEIEMLEMARALASPFVRVNATGGLTVPAPCVGKL